MTALTDAIDDCLPQTQCRRCGYSGCRPYAQAIAAGEAPINRCPPGGDATVAALAKLLRIEPIALDRHRGGFDRVKLARIDEATCIGCARCLIACPVDAIIGAPRRMHTVVADWCTGCELCLAPCPVDCIELIDAAQPSWSPADAAQARRRHHQREQRLARKAAERHRRGSLTPARAAVQPSALPGLASNDAHAPADRDQPTLSEKRSIVAAALARARARRSARR